MIAPRYIAVWLVSLSFLSGQEEKTPPDNIELVHHPKSFSGIVEY